MAFGDPWEGHVDPAHAADLAASLHQAGCEQIALGDTIGTATPGHVRAVLRAIISAGVPKDVLAPHFHDTYADGTGQRPCCLGRRGDDLRCLGRGLGRRPFAPGAAGNLATEELIWLLDGLGIDTGVDLDSLTEASLWFSGRTGKPAPSRVVSAHASHRTV